jgi:biotin operon repressor
MTDGSDDSEPTDGRRTYTDEQFLDALRDGCETTREVADTLGISRQGAHKRLSTLRDDGAITSREVGGTLLWSIRSDE